MFCQQHAHLCTTEIIGLLGGDYNESAGILEINEATPCKSLSTGMQCEMDPGRSIQRWGDLVLCESDTFESITFT